MIIRPGTPDRIVIILLPKIRRWVSTSVKLDFLISVIDVQTSVSGNCRGHGAPPKGWNRFLHNSSSRFYRSEKMHFFPPILTWPRWVMFFTVCWIFWSLWLVYMQHLPVTIAGTVPHPRGETGVYITLLASSPDQKKSISTPTKVGCIFLIFLHF